MFYRYVLVYFSILSLRYNAGIVTDEMLSLPKTPYVAVGLLEALGAATGMAAGGNAILIVLWSLTIAFASQAHCFPEEKKLGFAIFLNTILYHLPWSGHKSRIWIWVADVVAPCNNLMMPCTTMSGYKTKVVR